MGLLTWSLPAMACFATRFPYGAEITRDGLARVAVAEEALDALGLLGARVRVHGDAARVEVDPSRIGEVAGPMREAVAAALKKAGFLYASLDLDGYRTGSMNEGLKAR